jgi:long-chain acyl-CoA synthetase
MLGYWDNEEATRSAVDAEGWLHTGDQAHIDEGGHIFITGRLKEIIVLANGEKVSPGDMEMAISMDPIFEQVMIVGEAKAFLGALCVLNEEYWREFAAEQGADPDDPASLNDKGVERALMARMQAQLKDFPGYAQIRRLAATLEPWTVDNGLLTPTMKMKRAKILAQFEREVEAMYAGHQV